MKKEAKQGCLFASRFLEKHVGKAILYNPKVAIIELIANSWDAGSTEVKINWPSGEPNDFFHIEDNGTGLIEDELEHRWRTISYDRREELGDNVIFPKDITLPNRYAFGQNGVGRFAGFCFAPTYYIETIKNGKKLNYEISENSSGNPFDVKKIRESKAKGHGTKIYTALPSKTKLEQSDISAEIGMRFLTDPNFSISINGQKVTLSHIPKDHLSYKEISIPEVGTLKITIIDTKATDKTTKQHGIAWHVRNRLVGDCSWKGYGFKELIDGRRIEARRYIFIINADFLKSATLPDWSGFIQKDPLFEKAREVVVKEVRHFVLKLTKEKRKEVLHDVTSAHIFKLEKMPQFKRKKWREFVETVQVECPSIKDNDLIKLSGVLANLELSGSKFKLISQLHDLGPQQLDNLHNILADWSVDYAKEVLDELKVRIQLLDELKRKVLDEKTDEVHELQPLFHQGLWIFGPEFESMEFTSNEGMTKVIQKLFGKTIKGTRNRPDFAILPESSVGSYYYPTYDEDFLENGVQRLVIVELKKPGVSISEKEKSQCWKYVKELYKKGLIQQKITQVTCFVLGSAIDPFEGKETKQDNMVHIIPLDYNIIIARAKSRLLKLYDRVKGAPFLSDQNLEDNPVIQSSLL